MVPSNTVDVLNACGYPPEMSITETGLFSGIPLHPYVNSPLTFLVTDNNNITTAKSINFSAVGLQVTCSFHSGTGTVIQYGDTVNMDITLTNEGIFTIHDIQAALAHDCPYLDLIDSIAFIGDLLPGETIALDNVCSMNVSQFVSDQVRLTTTLNITSAEYVFQRTPGFIVSAPDMKVDEIVIEDGDNHRLDPGETANVTIKIRNAGHASAKDLNAILSSGDTLLVINSFSGSIVTLTPDSASTWVCNITSSTGAPFQHLYSILCLLDSYPGYSKIDTAWLFSGEIVEDFETGNFKKFNWFIGGNGLFSHDSLEHFEGKFCSRSGMISDNMESTLSLEMNVLQNGTIGFNKKVSCEQDPSGTIHFDHFAFFMDNIEMGRWDGMVDWSAESYAVSTGFHTFKWVYHKDNSINSGSDCAWLDFITLPPFSDAFTALAVMPSLIEKTIIKGNVLEDSIYITNTGGGCLNYSAVVYDTSTSHKNLLMSKGLAGSSLQCNFSEFIPGNPFIWYLTVYNRSNDSSSVQKVKLDIPKGIRLTNVSDFSGGSLGKLVLQNTFTGTDTLVWTGIIPEGQGVLKPGESASCQLSGIIDKSFMKDLFMVYTLTGSAPGPTTDQLSGTLNLKNIGLPNGWLQLDPLSGSVFHAGTDTVMVRINTRNLAMKTYTCKIVINDGFNNQVVVPVILHVADSNSNINPASEKLLVTSYPNPFSHSAQIEYMINEQSVVTAEVFNTSGEKIKTLASGMEEKGKHRLTWYGNTDSGNPVPDGIYCCMIKAGRQNGLVKLIVKR